MRNESLKTDGDGRHGKKTAAGCFQPLPELKIIIKFRESIQLSSGCFSFSLTCNYNYWP